MTTGSFLYDTSFESDLGYQCSIRRVIDHYGQFQNGRRKIHGFPRNVLLNMVFLNFASQARFECLILHFIVRSSIYKCWNVIFKTQSKISERYYLAQRHPLSQNMRTNAYFLVIFTALKLFFDFFVFLVKISRLHSFK